MNRYVCLVIVMLVSGCAKYVTPGGPAEMRHLGVAGMTEEERRELTDRSVLEALDKKPLAAFPTGLAVARVQEPGYESFTNRGYGTGKYSVVTTREAGDEEHLARLELLPMVKGVAPLGRILLPAQLDSDLPLRHAAGTLHADILLIYTVDTRFQEVGNPQLANVLLLGHLKDREMVVTSTISAALLDTRNGYVYGIAEGSATRRQATSGWNKAEVVDASRRAVESEAMGKLVKDVERVWKGVVEEYATGQR